MPPPLAPDSMFVIITFPLPPPTPDPQSLDRISEEEASLERIVAADEAAFGPAASDAAKEASGQASLMRGVPVEWLARFTDQHDCWHWTTVRVRDDIILRATWESRVRYTELPEMAEVVRPAAHFVSHAWEATWGDLVAACLTYLPPGACVWVDLFSVRQWPGNGLDLEFKTVVKLCKTVLLVTSTDSTGGGSLTSPSIHTPASDPTTNDKSHSHSHSHSLTHPLARPPARPVLANAQLSEVLGAGGVPQTVVPKPETRKCIGLLRMWCLVEIAAARETRVPIVMVAGTRGSAGRRTITPDPYTLVKLLFLVDIVHSECLFASDREKYLLGELTTDHQPAWHVFFQNFIL